MVLKEYTDKEMIEELTLAIEELGGSLIPELEVPGNLFKLSIDSELQDQAHFIVNTIANKYKLKRKELMLSNPLMRAKQIREDLYGKGV